MKKVIGLLLLLSLLLVGCNNKKITVQETKDIYQKIYSLSDKLGEATYKTDKLEYINISDKAKDILNNVENIQLDSESKELMISSCNEIIKNCTIQIENGWDEGSKTYQNVSDSINDLEKHIENLK